MMAQTTQPNEPAATHGHEAYIVAEAGDRAINEQIAKQHPRLKPILKPTSQCVYCAAHSVTVRTGQLGNRYGLCASCQRSQDKPLAFEAAFEESAGAMGSRAEAAGRFLAALERDREASA
jgi:hypothetical protein